MIFPQNHTLSISFLLILFILFFSHKRLPIDPSFSADEFIQSCPTNLSGADFYSITNRARQAALKRLISYQEENKLPLVEHDLIFLTESLWSVSSRLWTRRLYSNTRNISIATRISNNFWIKILIRTWDHFFFLVWLRNCNRIHGLNEFSEHLFSMI